MAKINILPAQVYNRIAAGEVVDRPYSVVKELVENAIDAGATQIEISIEGGGKQLIRVTDNGSGIERDDLQSAFLPHATSKIATAKDLENIVTLGFRGEAVASIASVSKMTITSRTENGNAYSLTSDGGQLGKIMPAAAEKGTDVKVEMLFFNTPVRLGFLKSDKAEEAEITTFVSRFILSRPEIAFTYYVDGRQVLQSFGGGEEEAFVSVYDTATLRNCYRIDAERNGIRMRGYIGNQNFFKANKSYQTVFLNGRYILNQTIATAIMKAYQSYLMKRQFPFYVLYIDVPPQIVDVNVHPNKADVRFSDNNIIFGSIYRIVESVLEGNASALEYVTLEDGQPSTPVTPQQTEKTEKEKAFLSYAQALEEIKRSAPVGGLPFEDVKPPQVKKTAEESKPTKKTSGLSDAFPDLFAPPFGMFLRDETKTTEEQPVVDAFAENKRFLDGLDEYEAKQPKIELTDYHYVGTAFNTYLIYECLEDLYFIDQHAAHERLIFNRLKEQIENKQVLKQSMLVHYGMQVNSFEAEFLRERLEDIRQMGFEIEETKENYFSITAIPFELSGMDIGVFLHDILAEINNFRQIRLADLIKDKLAGAACKAAIKGGRKLTQAEIDNLFKMIDGNMGLKCPHGRPVVTKFSRKEIEKLFKRIVK